MMIGTVDVDDNRLMDEMTETAQMPLGAKAKSKNFRFKDLKIIIWDNA